MGEHKFYAGDVVELKSGGPPMTVGNRVLYDGVYCTWINERGAPQSYTFPEVCLKMYVPQAKG